MSKNTFATAALFAAAVFLSACSSPLKKTDEKELNAHRSAEEMHSLLLRNEEKKDRAIREYIRAMSTEEKIAQLFLINLEGSEHFLPVEWYQTQTALPNGESKTVKKTLIPGGYIFFGYNIADNPSRVIDFTSSVLEHASAQPSVPPFLAVDAEGGFVNRLRSLAGALPENERVAQCLTPELSYQLYSLYAGQFSLLGFHLNIAPVVEICTDKNREFLSGRSYGSPEQVASYASKMLLAYKNNSVGTVVKHFPGNTNIDPHIGLPKLEMTSDDFENVVQCFSQILKEEPDGLLMSHAVVPGFDERPSCLSPFWVSDIVRGKMKYGGIVFSDDIFMGALVNNGYSPKEASRAAVEVGIDCILVSEKKFGRWLSVLTEICKEDETFEKKIEESVFRILKFKLRRNLIQCEYRAETDSYTLLPFSFAAPSAEKKAEAVKTFYDNKKKIDGMYYSYFYATASDEEKKLFKADVN